MKRSIVGVLVACALSTPLALTARPAGAAGNGCQAVGFPTGQCSYKAATKRGSWEEVLIPGGSFQIKIYDASGVLRSHVDCSGPITLCEPGYVKTYVGGRVKISITNGIIRMQDDPFPQPIPL